MVCVTAQDPYKVLIFEWEVAVHVWRIRIKMCGLCHVNYHKDKIFLWCPRIKRPYTYLKGAAAVKWHAFAFNDSTCAARLIIPPFHHVHVPYRHAEWVRGCRSQLRHIRTVGNREGFCGQGRRFVKSQSRFVCEAVSDYFKTTAAAAAAAVAIRLAYLDSPLHRRFFLLVFAPVPNSSSLAPFL